MDSNGLQFDDLYGYTGGHAGIYDVACPSCGPTRRRPVNRVRKVMRIWDDGNGFITFNCERCGIAGHASDGKSKGHRKEAHRKPVETPQREVGASERIELANALWGRAGPICGTLAETYLRSRSCFVDSSNLRYLAPRRDGYGPTMIARFGENGPITGVHLTRLAPDGTRKAAIDKPKIMLGPSSGQPIVVQDNMERGECVVSEGIEDAGSWALATGWTCWAAGSAGRIPCVVKAAARFDKVYISVDGDEAGCAAFKEAREFRPGVIKIACGRYRSGQDANKIIRDLGPDGLTDCMRQAELIHRRNNREINQATLLREWGNAGI